MAELTFSPRTEMYLTLLGEGDEIRRAMGSRAITEWQTADGGQHEVTVRVEDQADSDRLIDSLRAAGISVVAMARHRQTLEEAFLAALAENRPTGEESP